MTSHETPAQGEILPALSVVVPTRNAAAHLLAVALELRRVLDACQLPYECWYVNDASTDATAEQLAALAAQWPQLGYVSLARNAGQWLAGAAGLAQTRAPVIAQLDDDGEHPPRLVPELLRLLECYQAAQLVYALPQHRRTGVRKLAERLTGQPAASSFRVFRAGLLPAHRRLPMHFEAWEQQQLQPAQRRYLTYTAPASRRAKSSYSRMQKLGLVARHITRKRFTDWPQIAMRHSPRVGR